MELLADEDQQKVINAKDGHFLVLASAGCGKTEMLSRRIFKAHDVDGVPYSDMLCLTFTNRASRGMADRIKAKGTNTDGLFVGNLHRFCSQFLFDNRIIHPDTAVVEGDDINDILDEFETRKCADSDKAYDISENYMIVYNLSHFIEQIRDGHPKELILNPSNGILTCFCSLFNIQPGNGQHNVQAIADFLANVKGEGWRDKIIELKNQLTAGQDGDASSKDNQTIVRTVAAFAYNDYKERFNVIDFDSLLIKAYTVLSNRKQQKKLVHDCYHWVQIDEVQDLNPLQMAIADALTAKEHETVVYLGDFQQSIFSFMGTRRETMDRLADNCEIIRLGTNYRSPQYLLNVFNTFAQCELHTNPKMLPQTKNNVQAERFDLLLRNYDTKNSNLAKLSDAVKFYQKKGANERTAIIVNANRDADTIAKSLQDNEISCYKISGQDRFKTAFFKTLLAHFSVIARETNSMEWARILFFFHIFRSFTDCRRFVNSYLRKAAISPVDLIDYNGSTYLKEFCKVYDDQELVIFDTETTGLDIYNDDIVQIAAIKVKNGQKVEGSDFNLFLHTDRHIPEKLGDIINPLIEEYKKVQPVDRNKGLQQFLDYVGNDSVLGHNVNFDYHILKFNLLRDCNGLRLEDHMKSVYDSLKLIRLVEPKLKAYKLKILLEVLHLEGANSHMADDDILATKSVVDHIRQKAAELNDLHESALKWLTEKDIFSKVQQSYGPIFRHTRNQLHALPAGNKCALTNEMGYVSNEFAKIKEPEHDYSYFYKFLEKSVVDQQTEPHLDQQIYNHAMDLKTYNESDLCDDQIINEKVFVLTVHKAKGLEFENVIVFGAVEGVYPFFRDQTPEEFNESARKFYVAISRAKKRLCITCYGLNEYSHATSPSRYIKCIQQYFTQS